MPTLFQQLRSYADHCLANGLVPERPIPLTYEQWRDLQAEADFIEYRKKIKANQTLNQNLYFVHGLQILPQPPTQPVPPFASFITTTNAVQKP